MAQTQPSAAYIPRHAARDSARINFPSNLGPNNPLPHQVTRNSSRGGSLPTRLTPLELVAESTTSSQDELTPKTPEASRIIDGLMADYHARRRSSTSQQSTSTRRSSGQSTSTRRSSGRSFMDKVVDYYKPDRRDSVYSLNGGYPATSGNSRRCSMAEVLEDGQEKGSNRWSRISGSMQWGFSRDRDSEGDERAGRNSWESSAAAARRRSSGMTLSPG